MFGFRTFFIYLRILVYLVIHDSGQALGKTLRNSGNTDVDALHEFVKLSLEALSV